MPTSTAYYRNGQAGATQSPFAVGPAGGLDFGGLLARQIALREQMSRLQLARMQQELQLAAQQARQGQLQYEYMRNPWKAQGLPTGSPVHGVAPGSFTQQQMQKGEEAAKAYQMAVALNTGPGKSMEYQQPTYEMIRAIGIPAATAGLTQSGALFAQPSGAAVGPTAAGAMFEAAQGLPMGPGGQLAIGGAYAPGGLGAFRYMPGTMPMVEGSTAEKGGRVPKTGTYKLHKDEIVIPPKVANALVPPTSKYPWTGQAKPTAPPGYKLYERARKGRVVASYKEGSPGWQELIKALILQSPQYRYFAGFGGPPSGYGLGAALPDIARAVREARTGAQDFKPWASLPPNPYVTPSPTPTLPEAPTLPFPTRTPDISRIPQPTTPPGGGTLTVLGRPGAGGMTQFGVPGQLPATVRRGEQEPYRLPPTQPLAPKTEDERIADLESEAANYRQQANYQEARARVLQSYTDKRGTVPPEVRQMVQQRMQSAAFWMKQADTLSAQVKEQRDEQIKRAAISGEMTGEIVRAMGAAKGREAGETAKSGQAAFDNLMKGRAQALESLRKGEIKEGDYQLLMTQYFAPFVGGLARATNKPVDQVMKIISDLALSELSDPAAAQKMTVQIALISDMLRSGRLGGTASAE